MCLRCLQYLQTSCWFLSGQPSRHNSRVTVTETLARHSDFAGGQEPCDRDCSAWPTGGAWSWLFEVTTLGTWISCVCVREASAATRQKAEEAAERMLMQHARFKPLEDSAVAAEMYG